MKPILLLLLLAITSCSTPEQELLNKPTQTNPKSVQLAVGCGTIFSVNSIWSNGSQSTFVGIRYDLLLDTPQSGFTKGYFILNDALNTPTTEQYFTNGQTNYVCRNDLTLY